jgi:hypothetical protein
LGGRAIQLSVAALTSLGSKAYALVKKVTQLVSQFCVLVGYFGVNFANWRCVRLKEDESGQRDGEDQGDVDVSLNSPNHLYNGITKSKRSCAKRRKQIVTTRMAQYLTLYSSAQGVTLTPWGGRLYADATLNLLHRLCELIRTRG